MADNKKQQGGVTSGLMSADEGWSYLNSLSGQYLDKLLSTYHAHVEGWKITNKEKGQSLTVKIVFDGNPASANVNYWTWLIGSALFPGFGKPFIQTGVLSGSMVGYASFMYWHEVNYRESKQSQNQF